MNLSVMTRRLERRRACVLGLEQPLDGKPCLNRLPDRRVVLANQVVVRRCVHNFGAESYGNLVCREELILLRGAENRLLRIRQSQDWRTTLVVTEVDLIEGPGLCRPLQQLTHQQRLHHVVGSRLRVRQRLPQTSRCVDALSELASLRRCAAEAVFNDASGAYVGGAVEDCA